jgi:hypothetical protein
VLAQQPSREPVSEGRAAALATKNVVTTEEIRQSLASNSSNSIAPSKAKADPLIKPKRFQLDYGDVAYWGGAMVDTATSAGKRELNPLLSDSNGRFSMWKNFAVKGGLWGSFKVLEAYYPERRRVMIWTKIGAGAAFFAVGFFHNRHISRPR